jgi:hypothetical protein
MPSCSLLRIQLISSDDTVAALGVTADSRSNVSGTCREDKAQKQGIDRYCQQHPVSKQAGTHHIAHTSQRLELIGTRAC